MLRGNSQQRYFSTLDEDDLNVKAGLVYRLKDNIEEISKDVYKRQRVERKEGFTADSVFIYYRGAIRSYKKVLEYAPGTTAVSYTHLDVYKRQIFDTDKYCSKIENFWSDITNSYSYDDAKAVDPEPLRLSLIHI